MSGVFLPPQHHLSATAEHLPPKYHLVRADPVDLYHGMGKDERVTKQLRSETALILTGMFNLVKVSLLLKSVLGLKSCFLFVTVKVSSAGRMFSHSVILGVVVVRLFHDSVMDFSWL